MQRLGRAAQRRRRSPRACPSRGDVGEQLHRGRIVLPCDDCALRCARTMADPTLAQRLLDGDRRALARAISLVEDDRPEGWELVKEVYPHTGNAAVVGFTGPPGVGKSTLIGALTKAAPRGRAQRRRAVDRPVLAVHAGRAARRSHPPDRALPRPGRVHPLDGQPRRARRALGGRAAGGAAARRGRARGRVRRDRRRRPGGDRHHRPRRHDRARADARLGRLDPGAEGRRDGDPGRDRDQQGRPPADRHDGARDPRRAVAGEPRPHARGGARQLARADRQDRGQPRQRASTSWSSAWTSTARTSSPRASWPSAARATCATRCSRSPPRACAGAWRRSSTRTPSSSAARAGRGAPAGPGERGGGAARTRRGRRARPDRAKL